MTAHSRCWNNIRDARSGIKNLLVLIAMLSVLVPVASAMADEFVATGTYTGNGESTQSITGLSFQPEFIIVKSENGTHSYAKTIGMPEGLSKNLAKPEALKTGYINTLEPAGFTVGNKAEVNGLGVQYYWVAMNSLDGALEIGEYIGDGETYREVPLLNMFPDAGLIMSGEASLTVFRHAGMDLLNGYAFDGSGTVENSFAYFSENGFYVLGGDAVNKSGKTYYYVVWKAESHAVEFGYYEGNPAADQEITGLNINPEYLMITNNTTEPPVQRPASLLGDNTLFFSDNEVQSDLIQSMWDGGFRVGTQNSVNGENHTYHWMAMANPPLQADLLVEAIIDNHTPSEGQTVSITLTTTNLGPNVPANIQVTEILPAGLSFVSATVNQGTYDDASGIWDIGSLADNQSVNAEISATVDAGTAGSTITSTVTVSASDLLDLNDANNSASLEIIVLGNTGSDMEVSLAVDDDYPDEGQSFVYTVSVTNNGPDDATNVQITDILPVVLTLLDSVPSLGSYNGGTGVWDLPNFTAGETQTLILTALAHNGTSGTTITNSAALTAIDQTDPNSANNSATIDITINSVDLQILKLVDNPTPSEGATITYTILANNLGPGQATEVRIADSLPAGVTFVSAIPSLGAYNTDTEIWNLGTMAPAESQSLTIVATVDAGTIGNTISNTASLNNISEDETNPANNSSTAEILISLAPVSGNSLWPVVGSTSNTMPGAKVGETVLTFAFVNLGAEQDTLRSMTISNMTEGSGAQLLLDAEWQPLALSYVTNSPAPGTKTMDPVYRNFADGRAVFDNLQLPISPGDTIHVSVEGKASLDARDSALLTAGVTDSSDLVFAQAYTLTQGWPLVSGHGLDVDGFVAAQAAVIPQESALLAIGSQQNLALTVDLPGNGYLDDTLYGLSLKNNGSAQPNSDISGMHLWADDGNGTFGISDTLLGQAIYSGDLWQLTGLNVPVPSGGIRIFATVDIAETAGPSRDIRLSLPVGNGFAVEMYSGNDGPIDYSLENPSTLGISVTDRIILSAEWFLSGVALPGTNDTPLLQFLLTNTYTDVRQLESLAFTNTTEALGATPEQKDATCQQVYLILDANNNGELDDVTVDTQLASGIFVDGKVMFSGLNFSLAPDASTRLFVTADLGLATVADGNRIMGELQSIADISIPGSTVVATWPLKSGAEWVVNGMVVEQLTNHNISVLTLGPGEGPILAMDLLIPANGYAEDELIGISFTNEGSATADDLLVAELWEDGGDGVFNAGLGDDELLCPLTLSGNTWSSTVLSRTIPIQGSRLFTSITVAEAPHDSVTVKLGIPINGITVSSGMDGPIDDSIKGIGNLVISTSPLRTAVSFTAHATNTGQTGTITMTLRNTGSDTVTDILPVLNFNTGDNLLTLYAPSPSIIPALAPGEDSAFSWEYLSDNPGEVVMEGNVQGVVNGIQVRRSIITPTSVHRIYTPVPGLDLYPTTNLPFSINRGQQGVFPLTLTFINPGGDDVADAELSSIRLRLFESIDGPAIAPAELLDQVVVAEGTNIYFTSLGGDLSSEAQDFDLVFTDPVIVTGSEPVTLGIRLDLRLNSTVPSFLVSIEDATWLVGNDAINHNSLTVSPGEGSFPLRTGQAMLVSQAVGLNVAINSSGDGVTVPGQNDILLAEINLSQSVVDDNSSSIDLGRLAFEFKDADGNPITNPSLYFENLSLRSSFQEHFSGEAIAEADSLVVLQLSAPVTITGSTVISLGLYGDIAADSPLGPITPLVGSVDYFDARDGNMNNPVPVTLTTDPQGATLNILGPASTLTAQATGTMPGQISQGTRNLTAMELTLANPGNIGSSATTCDTIILEFYDVARQPLAIDPYLDRVRLLSASQELGSILDPVTENGRLAIPLTGLVLDPGQGSDVQISLDFKINAPVGTMEIVLRADGIIARDSISGQILEIIAAAGTSLPVSSSVASIVMPADELSVAATNLMPPLLVPGDQPSPVFSLVFANPAADGSGGIEINHLTLGEPADKAELQTLGSMLSSVQLLQGDTIVASTEVLDEAATAVTLIPDSALIVEAGQSLELVVEVVLRETVSEGTLSLTIAEDGIGAGPPGGGGLSVRILAASGQLFPFITEKGNIGGASLEESYANFPNPFAAGREPTTFAFSLEQDARISLRIMTPHGELVKTILQNESRTAGFYQDDQWQGFNGNGSPVHNGVYLAELTVQYGDGSKERILRKVAVVR